MLLGEWPETSVNLRELLDGLLGELRALAEMRVAVDAGEEGK